MMDYNSELEQEQALFSKGRFSGDGSVYLTPLKAYKPKYLIQNDQSPSEETQKVAEIYCSIDTTDLKAAAEYFDRGEDDVPEPDFIDERIEQPLNEVDPNEFVILFIEISETQELGQDDIRRVIELSTRYSDVIVMPHQRGLVQRILNSKGRTDPTQSDLPDNFYRAYYNGVTEFLEQSETLDKPVMGIYPLFGVDHRRNAHLEDFATYGVDGMCVDFRNKTPSEVDELGHILNGLRARGFIEDTFLYALNPRYHSQKTDEGYRIAEDFLLGAQAFDIIGELHFGFGSRSNGPIESLRVFDKNGGGYREVEISNMWEICSDSGFSARMMQRDPETASENTRLLCCEQIQLEFQNLRSHIDRGTAFDYLREKDGVPEEAEQKLKDLFNFYSLAEEGGLGQF